MPSLYPLSKIWFVSGAQTSAISSSSVNPYLKPGPNRPIIEDLRRKRQPKSLDEVGEYLCEVREGRLAAYLIFPRRAKVGGRRGVAQS